MLQETERNIALDVVPLSKLMHLFTKRYVRTLYSRLQHLPFNRYFYVVVLVGRSEPPMSQNALGQILEMDKGSVARILNYLCEEGIVERQQNPEDRRQHQLYVTDEGKKWLPEIELAIRELNGNLAKLVEGSPRQWLNDMLRMADTLSEEDQVPLEEEVEVLLSKSKA